MNTDSIVILALDNGSVAFSFKETKQLLSPVNVVIILGDDNSLSLSNSVSLYGRALFLSLTVVFNSVPI